LNRPSARASNVSKPLHLILLHSIGWQIPASIATSSADAAWAFIEHHSSKVVYKSCGWMRSTVEKIKPRDKDRLVSLSRCPVLFQQFVDGPDCRVHVLGDLVFPLWLYSKLTDFRQNITECRFVEAPLCARVRSLCTRSAAVLGTGLAGIDLKLNSLDGSIVALESNSLPAFDEFDHRMGNCIARALARY
jgi:glutathione synthase/RimK-type ligase-like ATP-grasp enzyme